MKKPTLPASVIIVVHESTPDGPGHQLKDYFLQHHVQKIIFIAHPLLFFKDGFTKSSRIEIYQNNKQNIYYAPHYNMPEYFLYVKDSIYTILWTLHYGSGSELFVGVGNLNAVAGYILQVIGVVKVSVYYVIDYIEQRFSSSVMNLIYHYADKLAAQHCSVTWNLSIRMVNLRQKRWKRVFHRQLIVPHGVHVNRITHVPFSKAHKNEVIYMGTISEKQGVQCMIRAIPLIITKIHHFHFTILGDGPYRNVLQKLIQQLHLSTFVSLEGHIKNHKVLEDRIAQAALAVALYVPSDNQFTYNTDPGKVKIYLGAGVPILITDVPTIARELQKRKCGIITNYDPKSVAQAVINLLTDKQMLKDYRTRALSYGRSLSWEDIFNKALVSTL